MNFEDAGDWGPEEADEYSDGYDISLVFLRPDGGTEIKDPHWLVDSGFDLLAPGLYGSRTAWSRLTFVEEDQLAEEALVTFSRLNEMVWDDWYRRRSPA